MEKSKPVVEECIVVEGRDDTVAVQRAVQADTIETIGSSVPSHVIEKIKLAESRRGVIILTDPDYPGERIRRIVSEAVPACKHAFISKKEAKTADGKSIGIEHAQPQTIRRALEKVRKPVMHAKENTELSIEEVRAAGLLAGPDARERRALVGDHLNIGYANGKQFLKRLHIFRISRQEFQEAVAKVKQQNEESSQ
ncbi:ribonuclease M5 [Salicibibacter halophilus]|uniref:Ribonuclease M5 n=1 Tax=Salicibibacter halophilus TaxID=2502791 RepID=A0A514LI96_9BACI|nr:ribonuclease M5 [Salicibibacter halophilus]QDI91572.1 ribonuclease M5 [Salicibibacter halophilus]